MNSEFWVMAKKQENDFFRVHEKDHPWHLLPSVSIVELTPDELVYVWPRIPKYETLCMACLNMKQRCHDICQTEVLPGYPCRFEAVPESEQCQDFDDFLIDGEFLVECGYYISFEDFKRQNRFTDKDFFFYGIGSFPSIRGARRALREFTDVLYGNI